MNRESMISEILRIVPPPTRRALDARKALESLSQERLTKLASDLAATEAKLPAGETAKTVTAEAPEAARRLSELAALRKEGLALLRSARHKISPMGEVTPEAKRAAASTVLVRLEREGQEGAASPLGLELSAAPADSGRMVLIEHLLSTYLKQPDAILDVSPDTQAHTLLHEAMHDPQISRFANVYLSSLASTICTLALGKASGIQFDASQTPAEREKLLRHIRATAAWRAFRNLLAHTPDMLTTSLDSSNAVRGLASMHRALEQFKPDAVVALAHGGEIVGNFLKNQVGLNADQYYVATRKGERVVLDRELAAAVALRRIVIIDDISRTGGTLAMVREQVLSGVESVKALALVSSAAATEKLQDLFLVLPFVSSSPAVSVPWNNRGTYAANAKVYVFGATKPEPLSVPKTFYSQVLSEVGH
jgi:adenine/guanine phosphoribosyltransferase-like PRPP-binding protein